MLLEVFSHNAPMTMVRLILTTQQTTIVNHFAWNLFLNLPCSHKIYKPRLISNPVSTILLILIQHRLSWGKQWLMNVTHTTYFLEKVCKIITLSKSGQLRDIIQTHIYNTLDARFSNK